MGDEILIIDDKVKLCKSLAQNFNNIGYKSYYSTNSHGAISLVSKYNIKAVLLDVMLGEENGLDVLKKLLTLNDKLPVIMITGYGTIETAVKSIKTGAFDYVQKPLNFNKLLKVIENAIELYNLSEENYNLKNRIVDLSPEMIIQDKKMKDLCNKAKRLASTDIPVLICGENGTGKELIADFIHKNSIRNIYRMVKVNCTAFPENLLDNELFGHEKGAYTGADSQYIGVFEKSHKSTLFLDEIGDMVFATQSKILRTLQNKEIRRIGGSKTIKVDMRFIASTNKDLEKLIVEKRFREDLFYRLNAATLKIPPLRERKEDIPLLIKYFIKEFSKNNLKKIKYVSDKVLKKFLEYNWPGNIRELKNTINYATAISLKDFVDIEDLPAIFTDIGKDDKEDGILAESEKRLILKMLQKSNYNKKKTAEMLKISRKTLYNKLRKYEISIER